MTTAQPTNKPFSQNPLITQPISGLIRKIGAFFNLVRGYAVERDSETSEVLGIVFVTEIAPLGPNLADITIRKDFRSL